MSVQAGLKYAETHEWAKVEEDVVVVGLSDHAQGELGDVVFVELPDVGDTVAQSEGCGTIEAVKTVSDLFAPVSGEIIEVNSALEDEPTLINTDCYDKGWIIKIKVSDASELEKLMDADAYKGIVE